MSRYSIAKVYDDHIDRVYRHIYHRVRDSAVAEDITSDCFLKVAEHLHTFTPKDGGTLQAWIFTIARHCLADYFRKHRDMVGLDDIDAIDPQPAIADRVDIKLSHERILSAIHTLPPRQREIILLRFAGQLRNKEIAAVLDISEKSVAASIAKSLATLRKHPNLT